MIGLILTIVGLVLTVALPLLFNYLDRRSKLFMERSLQELREANTDFLASFSEAISPALSFLVQLQHNSLREEYIKAEKGSNARRYWHYRWRFETYDHLDIYIKNPEDEEKHSYKIKILGSTTSPTKVGAETDHFYEDLYVVEIVDDRIIHKKGDDDLLFRDGQKLVCYYQDDQCLITEGASSLEDFLKYEFEIWGLGVAQGTSTDGKRKAEGVKYFKRTKDVPKKVEQEFHGILKKYQERQKLEEK